MGKETERRFLVRSDVWREAAGAGVKYFQGYFSTDPERNVRIRISDTEAILTIKGEAKGNTRPEFEYPIPLEEGLKLQAICLRPVLEKTRYKLEHEGLTWEIDVYAGDNKGLILAEVETDTEVRALRLPVWVGLEISGDVRYRNIDLVGKPFATWGTDAPQVRPKYHLKRSEDLPAGFRRIAKEQVQAAVEQLTTGRSLDDAVHEARKSLKKTRSLLRLVRPSMKDEYPRQNARLQRIGQNLSELRDAQALLETLHSLRTHASEAPEHSKDLQVELNQAFLLLDQRKEDIGKNMEAGGLIAKAVKLLENEAKALGSLPLKRIDAGVITESFERTYARGRKAFAKAYDEQDSENFHDFRKRVKDLRYQLGILSEVWPEVLHGYEDSAKELEGFLGDDHNLAVLRSALDQNGSKSKMPVLRTHIDNTQRVLRSKVKRLSTRLYSDPPKIWSRRLESSWAALR